MFFISEWSSCVFLSRLFILLTRTWMWSMVTPLRPDVCLLVRAEPPRLILGECCWKTHFLTSIIEIKVPFHFFVVYLRLYLASPKNRWAFNCCLLSLWMYSKCSTYIYNTYARKANKNVTKRMLLYMTIHSRALDICVRLQTGSRRVGCFIFQKMLWRERSNGGKQDQRFLVM